MPRKFNADTMFEPIELTLGGKDYAITRISKDQMDAVSMLSKKAKDDPDNPENQNSLVEQLAILLNVEASVLKDNDFRVLIAAVNFIMDAIKSDMEAHTPEAKKSAVSSPESA